MRRIISNTGKKKGGKGPLLHPPSPEESPLRAECFYVQVGGKESVRASEGNALILTLNLLQFPALPHAPTHGQDHRMRPALLVLAQCYGTSLAVSHLISSYAPGSLKEALWSESTVPTPSSNFPSHLIEWEEKEPSQTEARREKSPEMSRGELEMGPTVKALVAQGGG